MQTIKSVLAIVILPLFVFYSSCGETCEENLNRTQNVTVQFFDSLGVELQNQYSMVYGIGGNGNINYSDSARAYILPLNFNANSVAFVFGNAVAEDTVSFNYLESVDYKEKCRGFEVFIDSVNIQNSTFSNYDFENFNNRLTIEL